MMATNPKSLSESIERITAEDYPQVVDVWERSVRATHHFLTESDITEIKPLVQGELENLANVFCIRDQDRKVAGFVGFDHGKLEALFVDPSWHRAGIGRRLCDYALKFGDAMLVDVNEDNQQAIDFYLHIGFTVEGRSEVDSAGRPFPLLHLRYDLFATK